MGSHEAENQTCRGMGGIAKSSSWQQPQASGNAIEAQIDMGVAVCKIGSVFAPLRSPIYHAVLQKLGMVRTIKEKNSSLPIAIHKIEKNLAIGERKATVLAEPTPPKANPELLSIQAVVDSDVRGSIPSIMRMNEPRSVQRATTAKKARTFMPIPSEASLW